MSVERRGLGSSVGVVEEAYGLLGGRVALRGVALLRRIALLRGVAALGWVVSALVSSGAL